MGEPPGDFAAQRGVTLKLNGYVLRKGGCHPTLTVIRQCRTFGRVYTVIETPTFSRLAADYWTEEERSTFASYIAANPEGGDVVPDSGGVRKVRWSYAAVASGAG